MDYCPKCDCLVPQHSGKCLVCSSKTIILFVDTEKNSWPMLLAIIFGMVFFFVFLILDVMHSMAWTVIVSTAVISTIIFGSAYVMWKNHKPLMDGALERGRQLYSENKERYLDGETIKDTVSAPPAATRFPWSIRNVHRLRIALVIFCILVPVPFLLEILFVSTMQPGTVIWMAMCTSFFLMAAIMIYTGYGPAKRHYEVINAMELKPDEVEKSFKTMTVKSRIYGNFELSYDSDYGYHLTMAFDPDIAKPIPAGIIWTRPNMMSRLTGKPQDATFESLHIDRTQMEAVKCLKQVGVRDSYFGKTLFALVNDKAFHSEADDVVRTVSLMADVRKDIESHYANT